MEIIILSEIRQVKTNIKCYHLYVESKKMIQMNIFPKQKETRKIKLWLPKEKGRAERGIN